MVLGAPGLVQRAASAQVVLSSTGTIVHESSALGAPIRRGTGPFIACRLDYNADGSVNPDDIGDFITDYFSDPYPAGPGGYAASCPENEWPYTAGYRATYTSDGTPQCSPPFPDNLGDYITDYFGGCQPEPILSPLPNFTNASGASPPLQLPLAEIVDPFTGAHTTAVAGLGTLTAPGTLGVVVAPGTSLRQSLNASTSPDSAGQLRFTFNVSWQITSTFGPVAFAGAGLAMGGSLPPAPAPDGSCPPGNRNAAFILDAELFYAIPGGANGSVHLPAGAAPLGAEGTSCGTFLAAAADRALGLPASFPPGTVVSLQGTLTLSVRNDGPLAGIDTLQPAADNQGPAMVFVTFAPPGPPCTVDFNRDGMVDGDDLAAFQAAYTGAAIGPGGFAIPCPGLAPPFNRGYLADFNGDCVLTGADEAAFLAAYNTPGPSPVCPSDHIDNFTDIPGLVGAWDARLSAPTFNPATGEVLSLGAELSGHSAMSLVRGGGTAAPRWSGSPEGLLCLGQYDVAAAERGMGIRFELPPGDYSNLKLMAVVCCTPTNMGGDYSSDVMRLVATNSAGGRFSLSKRVARDVATDPGRTECNGGAGVALTTSRTGCERQVLGAYTAFPVPSAATAYVNGLGRSGPAACSSDHVASINVGFLTGENGAFQGIIHAVYLYALDTAGAANFAERDVRNASALLASQWGVTAAPTKAVSICGDSIAYASGTQNDDTVRPAASGGLNTTLTVGVAAGAGSVGGPATILVASRDPGGAPFFNLGNGGGGRYVIEPGTDRAEVVVIANGPLSGPGPLTLAGVVRFAHPAGSVVTDNAYGVVNPAASCWNRSRLTGGSTDVRLFNFAQPSSQLSSIYATNPSADGSTRVFDSVGAGGRTLFVQRGSNDINSGVAPATLFARARTFVANARINGGAGRPPPDRVVVCEVLPRAMWNAGSNGLAELYNTQTVNGLNDPSLGADAVCRFTRHPWLSDPENTGYIFVAETYGPTDVVSCVYDASGVHPRAFGQACMALAIDAAYAQAWGTTVGYAPAAPTLTSTRIASGGLRLNWSTPSSPGAPAMIGDTTSGASCLVAKINKNGSKLVWIAPVRINANTGRADYLTTYFDDEFVEGDTYTLRIEDAMGNLSPTVFVAP